MREEKETIQREKLRRLMHLEKFDKVSDKEEEDMSSSDAESSENNKENDDKESE